MKAWGIATFLLCLVAGPASAGSGLVVLPDWANFPYQTVPQSELYPEAAASQGMSGAATIRCSLEPGGDVDKCSLLSESPTGQGFGAKAIAVADFITVLTPPASAMVGRDRVDIPVAFNWPAGVAPAQTTLSLGGTMITEPDWKRIPSSSDLQAIWPAEATRQGVSGKARVVCDVTVEGLTDRCRLISEYPKGVGFGPAAIQATRYFAMKPETVDGVPVGGASVVIPFNFVSSGGPSTAPVSTINVLAAPVWAATPTLDQMKAAFPAGAIGKVDLGRVMVRCKVAADGSLHACDLLAEQPTGKGFGHAALGLTKAFKVRPDFYQDLKLTDYSVDIPISLFSPSQAGPDQITDPMWIQVIDQTKLQQIFPDEAFKAGVKTGRGVVSCVVAHSGALTNCQVVGEEPPGLGFGPAAATLADLMAMNPWTNQGRPVDGASIRLPLVLKLPPPSADAPAAKP